MAQGDLTKELENDKIEVVLKWNIHVRTVTKVLEEQADGIKQELNRSLHRHTLVPFVSERDADKKWTHTATDISGEDADVQAICNAAWTDSVKTAYKTWAEANLLARNS